MKTFHNRIAQSRFALPFCSVYALLTCIAAGLFSQMLWMPLLLLAASTLFLIQLNNHNSLIRIYSRMVSCAYLSGMSVASFLFSDTSGGFVSLCFIIFLFIICFAYQKPKATATVFYAFAGLGTASIFEVRILWFLPIFWLVLAVHLLAFNARTFSASLLGVLAPYWFGLLYLGLTEQLSWYGTHFAQLGAVCPLFDFSSWNLHHFVTYIYIGILGITGAVHFLLTSYKDKIRTRMIYEMLITILSACMLCIILQPALYPILLRLLIACTAPLIGHCFALSSGKGANIGFIGICILSLGLTIWNLWIN